MLYRRVLTHVRSQDWTAVVVDLVIVVVGVFIGIQVSNWNDDRLEAKRQIAYIERLREDFLGIDERLKEALAIYNEAIVHGGITMDTDDRRAADIQAIAQKMTAREFQVRMEAMEPFCLTTVRCRWSKRRRQCAFGSRTRRRADSRILWLTSNPI